MSLYTLFLETAGVLAIFEIFMYFLLILRVRFADIFLPTSLSMTIPLNYGIVSSTIPRFLYAFLEVGVAERIID